ncbi:MAG: hypothetical protein LBN04_07610 [Oscillospiraceae bacterium]|jgi:hypothetical protein|nr:hypothetical protein [Oscillospiraceae bacterium]
MKKCCAWWLLCALCLMLCAPAWAEGDLTAQADALVAAWMQTREAENLADGEDFLVKNGIAVAPDASIVSLEEAFRIAAVYLMRLLDDDGSALYGHRATGVLMPGETDELFWQLTFLAVPPGLGEPREPLGRIVMHLYPYPETAELRDIAITPAEEARPEDYTDEPKG